jgi:hypothetical protein
MAQKQEVSKHKKTQKIKHARMAIDLFMSREYAICKIGIGRIIGALTLANLNEPVSRCKSADRDIDFTSNPVRKDDLLAALKNFSFNI